MPLQRKRQAARRQRAQQKQAEDQRRQALIRMAAQGGQSRGGGGSFLSPLTKAHGQLGEQMDLGKQIGAPKPIQKLLSPTSSGNLAGFIPYGDPSEIAGLFGIGSGNAFGLLGPSTSFFKGLF